MKRLGIEAAMEGKAAQIPATPVGEIIAERKAAFGCQQLAELKPVHDIDIVGLMPREVNLVTEYSAAAVTASTKSAAAADFVRFLASRESAAVLEDTGLLPRTAR
jgi:molybdate transport system substrate-binding protein